MSRKGENIYQRKDKRWEARYIKEHDANGKAHYGYVYANSYTEARKRVQEIKQSLSKDALSSNVSEDKIPEILLSDVSKEWLSNVQMKVKESSYIKYQNLIVSYINPYYKNISIQNVTSESVDNFCETLIVDGGIINTGLSTKTISDTLSVLRMLLKYAQKKNLHPGCDGKGIRIKHESKSIQVLSKQEQKQLMAYLISHPSPKNIGILFCLFTGLRVGELSALKWNDISLSEKTVHVHETMQRIQTPKSEGAKTKILVSTPKSPCSVRSIPIPDEMLKVLEASREAIQDIFLPASRISSQNHE